MTLLTNELNDAMAKQEYERMEQIEEQICRLSDHYKEQQKMNLVKLIRVEKVNNNFTLNEVDVDPESVSYTMDNVSLRANLHHSKEAWPNGVSHGQRFSTIHMNDRTTIDVVGDPALVEQKIFENFKRLL